jgi:hypothetical protein
LTEGLGLIEGSVELSEDPNSNEHRATIRQGIIRILPCFLAMMEKKRSLSRQSSVLDFFRSYSRTRASMPVLLDFEDDDPDDSSRVQQEVPPAYVVTGFSFHIFCANFCINIFFLGRTVGLKSLSPF